MQAEWISKDKGYVQKLDFLLLACSGEINIFRRPDSFLGNSKSLKFVNKEMWLSLNCHEIFSEHEF